MYKKVLLTTKIFILCCISTACFADIDLSQFEAQVYSQQGEDGVIAKIFEVIGVDSKYCVEFGGSDGVSCSNTRKLLNFENWSGVMFDCEHENPSIGLYDEFLTAENINSVFKKYRVPYNLDLLSIDVDFNDFHIWRAISEQYRPRLVVIEFNAIFLPHEDRVVLYTPQGRGDGTNYFGASILAFTRLARSKGYSLVYVEKKGVNLFFVRDDLLKHAQQKFKNVNNVEALYQSAKYGTGPKGGHPQDPQNRPYASSQQYIP